MKEGLLAIVKFFLFLFILPLVIASALAFQIHILGLPVAKEQWILWGAVIFTLFYFFLYNFKEVYASGQMLVINIFKFLGGGAEAISYILPLYAILFVSLYLMLNVLGYAVKYEGYFLLAISFSLVMHLVLSAHQLYESDSGPLKAHYLFVFSFVFVIFLIAASGFLNAVIPEYSLLAYFKTFSSHAMGYYQSIYKLLFISPS